MHTTPSYQAPREVANAKPARRPDRRCSPIPVTARIVWADNGTEQYVDTYAEGWSGQDVYVDAAPIKRNHGYGRNYVWLDAADVRRR